MTHRAAGLRIFLALAFCGLCLLACSSDPRPRAEPAPEVKPTSPSPLIAQTVTARDPLLPQRPAPEPTLAELPIAEDFELAAQDEITSKNFRAALDAIEREMNAETD